MAMVLKCRCSACGCVLKVAFETPEDELPDCPVCSEAHPTGSNLDFDKPVNIAFGSVTNKAVELTHKIAEEHYGLTNMRGSAGGDVVTHHVGEVSHPPLTKTQQVMADAWTGAQTGKFQLPGGSQPGALMNMARSATQVAKMTGSPDPISVAHSALKKHGRKVTI